MMISTRALSNCSFAQTAKFSLSDADIRHNSTSLSLVPRGCASGLELSFRFDSLSFDHLRLRL